MGFLDAAAPQVMANFGNDLAANPFKGDVEAIRAEATQRLHSRILASPLPQSSEVRRLLLAAAAAPGGLWLAGRLVASQGGQNPVMIYPPVSLPLLLA